MNETIYYCHGCGLRVIAGSGYIHTSGAGWAIHHKDCAGDLTQEYCIAVPQHWTDLLSAHHYYAQAVTV